MGHGYASYVADFIHTNEDYLVGQLVANGACLRSPNWQWDVVMCTFEAT